MKYENLEIYLSSALTGRKPNSLPEFISRNLKSFAHQLEKARHRACQTNANISAPADKSARLFVTAATNRKLGQSVNFLILAIYESFPDVAVVGIGLAKVIFREKRKEVIK